MGIERVERRVQRRLARLPIGARRDLLHALGSSLEVRADLIRRAHERPEGRELAEILMDLEAEPLLRLDVLEALKDSVPLR